VKPVSSLLTLSVGKAGLRCAAEALFPDFAAQGVHIAVLTIGTAIAPGPRVLRQSERPSGVYTPSREISGFGKQTTAEPPQVIPTP
jgi:hypothetical protein